MLMVSACAMLRNETRKSNAARQTESCFLTIVRIER
jgi:hypothetical protein